MQRYRPRSADLRTFNLSRWFAIVGLVSITIISGLSGWAMSHFFSQTMLRQEGELTQEFIQTLVITERSLQSYFVGGIDQDSQELEAALEHIARMTDMLRANVYNRDRRIIWSSDPQLMGQQFGANDELDESLAGQLVVHTEEGEDQSGAGKAEHGDLATRSDLFIEIYVPVRAPGSDTVIGVIEFYKNPQKLFVALKTMRGYIVLGAALAGVFLFLALASLVRRADLLMQAQERRLIDAETLATIGEMSSAVAHGIRNPLASIRSSAELALEADGDVARDAAADIVAESDRLEAWVRELLSYSRPLDEQPQALSVRPLIDRCLDEFSRELERLRIATEVQIAPGLPTVQGNPLLLGQVIHSLVANAIEAMEHDGTLRLLAQAGPGNGELTLIVGDTGPGMDENQRLRAGKPFFTTKPHGLGVGLALARRIIERYGGRLEIDSVPGRGTNIRLVLPQA
jgi:signal transduction histidine kinase